MALKWRKRAILAKIETTYGTDAIPTGAANAILVSNLSITPLETDTLSRDLVGRGLGAQAQAIVGKRVMVEYDIEFSASGAAGTPPPWGPIIRGCGMSEIVNGVIDVRYDPIDENEESLTQYFFINRNKHPLLGARGTWGYRLSAKGYPYLHFSFTGLFAGPSDAVFPTPDFVAFQKPSVVNSTNTTFNLHGFAALLKDLSYDHNNEVVHRELVGVEEVRINDRNGGGSVTIEAPALSVKDYFFNVVFETEDTLQITNGTSAGNIIQISHPQVQITNPQYNEDEGDGMMTMDLTMPPSDAGNDDVHIIVR